MTPQIAILMPTGWSVRNFVRTDFLKVISRDADVTLVSPLADDRAFREEMESKRVAVEKFPPIEKGRIELFIEEFNKYCYFHRKQSNVARFHFDRSHMDGLSLRTRIYKRLLTDGSGIIDRVLPLSLLNTFERKLWEMMHGLDNEMSLLERIRPDLLVSTMPLSSRMERPMLWAAEHLGIRRGCVVQSWDNIYTKGLFPVEFGLYIVWSQHMKDRMTHEYPEIDPERVIPCGPLQFDFYKKFDRLLPREEFFQWIGADPSRPLLVWAGSSPGQTPGEPNAVALLCEQLRAGRVDGNPQLLLRPHPIGGGARFASVRERYPELLFTETNDIDPIKLVRWSPTFEDIVMHVSTVAHADVNINKGSTMTLDSCIFDRPVVNIAFDGREPGKPSTRLRRSYTYEHYQTVLEAGAVRMANTLEELIEHLNVYLDNPSLDREARAALLQLQCGQVDGRAAERVARSLLRLVGVETGEGCFNNLSAVSIP